MRSDRRAHEFDAVDDAGLLSACRPGLEPFAELYRRNAEPILAFLHRRTGCPQTAADLTAETFAAAFASRRAYRDTGAPARAWLFTIARRQLAHFVRHEKVRAKYRHRLGVDPITLSDSDIERVETLADLEPLRRALRDAVARLPHGQAEAVRLRVADSLPYAEVATRLGCSQGAARVRVSRGLTHLADLMEES